MIFEKTCFIYINFTTKWFIYIYIKRFNCGFIKILETIYLIHFRFFPLGSVLINWKYFYNYPHFFTWFTQNKNISIETSIALVSVNFSLLFFVLNLFKKYVFFSINFCGGEGCNYFILCKWAVRQENLWKRWIKRDVSRRFLPKMGKKSIEILPQEFQFSYHLISSDLTGGKAPLNT